MAEETWRVILESDLGGGVSGVGAPSAGASQESKSQKDMSDEIKKAGPQWANVGKFAGGLLGVVGALAFVIQMIRRSRIFTTFMDNFLLIFSAFIDVMMIPLIPIFSMALKWIVKLFPYIFELQKKITTFLEDPWGGIKDLLAKIPDWIKSGFDLIGGLFTNLGLEDLGKMFEDIGSILRDAINKIVPLFSDAIDKIREIWGNSGLGFWEKIKESAIIAFDAIKESGKVLWDAMTNIWYSDVLPVIKNFWTNTIAPNLEGLGTFGGIIKKAGDNLLAIWGDPNSSLWTKIVESAKVSWGIIKDVVITIWNDFYNNTLVPKWQDFCEVASVVWTAFTIDVKTNWTYLTQTYLPELWKWFTETWLPQAFSNALAKIPSMFVSTISGLLGSFWNAITGQEAETPPAAPIPNFPGISPAWPSVTPPVIPGGGAVSGTSGVWTPGGVINIPGYVPAMQRGTPFIPQTGLYLLHRGEAVIPTANNNNNRSVNINNIFNIATDAALLARKVSTTLDEEVRASYFKVF